VRGRPGAPISTNPAPALRGAFRDRPQLPSRRRDAPALGARSRRVDPSPLASFVVGGSGFGRPNLLEAGSKPSSEPVLRSPDGFRRRSFALPGRGRSRGRDSLDCRYRARGCLALELGLGKDAERLLADSLSGAGTGPRFVIAPPGRSSANWTAGRRMWFTPGLARGPFNPERIARSAERDRE